MLGDNSLSQSPRYSMTLNGGHLIYHMIGALKEISTRKILPHKAKVDCLPRYRLVPQNI